MIFNCSRIDFIETTLLIRFENALYRISTSSSFWENTANKLYNEALIVTPSQTPKNENCFNVIVGC